MRGVFNLRPPLSRYTETWDVQSVQRELKSMYSIQTLSIMDLTLKLVMLMVLTQVAKVQTLPLLDTTGIHIEQDSILVQLRGNIKQCRLHFNICTVKFQAYYKGTSLCVCVAIQHYLARTKKLRKGTFKETLCSSASSNHIKRLVKTPLPVG